MKKKLKEVKLECPKCHHRWPYRGSKLKEIGRGYPIYVSCGVCHNSNVNIEKHRVKLT